MFAPKIYSDRRRHLKQQIGSGVVLFLGNDQTPRNFPANPYSFVQDASFLYYWGVDLPGLAAVMDIENDREILFGNDFTVDDIVWMGPQTSLKEWSQRCGAKDACPEDQLKPFLEKAQAKKQSVHYLPPYRPENLLKIEHLTGIPHSQVNVQASKSLIHAVVEQRLIKSGEEVAELEQSLEITKEMYSLAMELTEPGKFEYEVIGRVEGMVLARGSRPAHSFILTTRGERLHAGGHTNQMKAGDLVVMDVGVESPRKYTSDVTRTFPVSKGFTPLQKEIYQIVLKANDAAIEMAAPGISFRDIHVHAASVITEGLQQMGIMKGNLQDSVSRGAHALFFPHGLGHPLGLEIHDLESLGEEHVGYNREIRRSSQFGLSHLRFARPLAQGMVMTIEPGIYFIPDLIRAWQSAGKFQEYIHFDKLESFLGFGGIRIEDDILVTPAGSRSLSRDIPKTLSELERE